MKHMQANGEKFAMWVLKLLRKNAACGNSDCDSDWSNASPHIVLFAI